MLIAARAVAVASAPVAIRPSLAKAVEMMLNAVRREFVPSQAFARVIPAMMFAKALIAEMVLSSRRIPRVLMKSATLAKTAIAALIACI